MYKDTKVYLRKYWKNLLGIIILIPGTFIGLMYAANYFVPYPDGDDSVYLSDCTKAIFETVYSDSKERNEEYYKYWTAYEYNPYTSMFLVTENCKFSKEETDLGFDKIYSNNLSAYKAFQETHSKNQFLYRMMDEINYDATTTEAEMFANYMPKFKTVFGDELLAKASTTDDLLVLGYAQQMKSHRDAVKMSNELNSKIDVEKTKERLKEVQKNIILKKYIIELKVISLPFVIVLLLAGLLYLISRIKHLRRIRFMVLCCFAGVILAILFVFCFYVLSYIYTVTMLH